MVNGGYEYVELIKTLGFIPPVTIIPKRIVKLAVKKLEQFGRKISGKSGLDLVHKLHAKLKDELSLNCNLLLKDGRIIPFKLGLGSSTPHFRVFFSEFNFLELFGMVSKNLKDDWSKTFSI